ncbi:hypothetical protein BS78_05G117400 [Paspalum vaginatum]|nr:hypothetical protein BS78_05G117400 [Paspalum vaginatum]
MCPNHCTWLHLRLHHSFRLLPLHRSSPLKGSPTHSHTPAPTSTLISPLYKAPAFRHPSDIISSPSSHHIRTDHTNPVFMCSIFPSSHSVIGVSAAQAEDGGGFRSPESRASSMSSGGSVSVASSSPAGCSRSWSISEDSLRRYVSYASESCIQELLAASDSGRGGDGDGDGDGDDGWKVLVYQNGVEISKRRSGPAHVFRSRWLLQDVSPERFMAVANAVDAAKLWESDQLVEASYIKELGEDLSIIHLKFGDASSTRRPARRRDLVVYERRQAMDDGTLVLAVASLPKEIAAGLLPPPAAKGGGASVGRGLVLQSGWVVERLDGDGSSCVVTYFVQLDPAAGWLPRCLVSRLNSKLVMIIAKLRRIAQATVPAAAGEV